MRPCDPAEPPDGGGSVWHYRGKCAEVCGFCYRRKPPSVAYGQRTPPDVPGRGGRRDPGVLFAASYLFSPTDRTDTAGGTRTPREPPGEERSPGKGNPFPESPTRRRCRFPASKRHRRPGTNPSPILRERFGVSFRFTVHAAEADDNRREIPPIPPLCCHTFVLLHTRLNSHAAS